MTFDPFRLESGLIDSADVTINDAIFTNRLDSFDPTKLELHLTVKPEGEDETTLYLGCGDGWETQDGGETAVRTDGADRNFHGSTKVGEFFTGLVKLMASDPAADKALRARASEFPLGPREAGFWKGLKVHIDRQDRKGSGDIPDFQVLVATGFLGIEGQAGAAATGPAAAGAKKAPAKKVAAAKKAAPAKAPAASGGVTDEIRAKLDEIADASGSHDEFMEAAFAQVPEASTDDEVKAAVADDGAGSIWQDAVDRYNASQG